jgi:Secretion system C-terminal sorting domain
MMRARLLLILMLLAVRSVAQYAPQAGLAGSTAIAAGSSQFVGWASGCAVQRGYMDIADTSLGLATVGDTTCAIGIADGSVVSLGDSGVAVLTFKHPIVDGPGADFAVFENGFRDVDDSTMAYLELGFVEVSSDGVNFTRFPATSLTPDTAQIPMAGVFMKASLLNNLAGKYIGGYGTPFDLSELAGTTGLDVNHIVAVRIVDVIGALSGHVSRDSAGRIVNDPYPTPVPSGGFDLDAVGVIHQSGTGVVELAKTWCSLYPNPASDVLKIQIDAANVGSMFTILDVTGRCLRNGVFDQTENSVSVADLQCGVYLLRLQAANGDQWTERFVKY